MLKFGRYAAASVVGAGGVVFHAFNSREQFYPAMLYLATSKVSLVLLFNMSLVVICAVWQVVKSIFLGTLREIEVERLNEQLWREVMEILFAMTVFRDEFDVFFVSFIIVLLFIKAFHWLAQTRVEYIETAPTVSRFSHMRITSFMALLLTLDCLFFSHSFSHLLKTREASVSLFFAFEYVILATATVATFVKYSLYLGDALRDGQWDNKAIYVFYLELVRDLLHLSLYLFFFLVIFRFKGLPLHLVRELYETFRNFKTRVTDFIRYRNVTSNMNDRFPDATAEELTRNDVTCIICREEMSAAKKLPCGHLFHIQCLRSWLERQQTCPTCRSSVLVPQAGTGVTLDPAAANQPQLLDAAAGRHGDAPTGSGQAPSAADLQPERLYDSASSAACQYESSVVYPTMRADFASWYPAYVTFVPQTYLAAIIGGGGHAEITTGTNSGFEPGGQAASNAVGTRAIPLNLEAQVWQTWLQMRTAATAATESCQGQRSSVSFWHGHGFASSRQPPAPVQQIYSFSGAANLAAEIDTNALESYGQEQDSNFVGLSLETWQGHLKLWIEVLERQLSSAVELQSCLGSVQQERLVNCSTLSQAEALD